MQYIFGHILCILFLCGTVQVLCSVYKYFDVQCADRTLVVRGQWSKSMLATSLVATLTFARCQYHQNPSAIRNHHLLTSKA